MTKPYVSGLPFSVWCNSWQSQLLLDASRFALFMLHHVVGMEDSQLTLERLKHKRELLAVSITHRNMIFLLFICCMLLYPLALAPVLLSSCFVSHADFFLSIAFFSSSQAALMAVLQSWPQLSPVLKGCIPTSSEVLLELSNELFVAERTMALKRLMVATCFFLDDLRRLDATTTISWRA